MLLITFITNTQTTIPDAREGQQEPLSRPDYYVRVGITYYNLNVILKVPLSTLNMPRDMYFLRGCTTYKCTKSTWCKVKGPHIFY